MLTSMKSQTPQRAPGSAVRWGAAPGCWLASACSLSRASGPVVAAGWLAATAVGAAAGAATGGIVGALVDAGVDREHADVYSELVRRGGTMVSVRARDEDADRIEAVLATYKPIDPVTRGAEYRKTGWQTFDEKAPPYRPNQAEIDRMRATGPAEPETNPCHEP